MKMFEKRKKQKGLEKKGGIFETCKSAPKLFAEEW